MFVESELTWTLAVKPSDLKSGLHIQRALLKKLLADFDKLKCSEKHGYYLCVTTLEGIGEGKIWEGKGCVAYKVRFRCLTYKPQKNEKVLAVVTGLTEKGVMCSCGPIEDMFLSTRMMSEGFTHVAQSDTKPAYFKGKDGSDIEIGTVLRVKIVGMKFGTLARTYETVCSTNGDYLGVDGRNWEDESAPQAAGGGGDWGTNVDANGTEAGGWGSDIPGYKGAGNWGASPPKESGGWGAAAAEKTNSVGRWDDVPAKTSGGWGDDTPSKKDNNGDSLGAAPATESAGCWGSPPAKTANNGRETAKDTAGGWDAAPAEKSNGGGGWGAATPGKNNGVGSAPAEKSKANGKWGTATDEAREDAGGWGSPPAKKSKGGGWDSTPAEKESTDCGGWGDSPTTTSGGGWGD